MIWIVSIVTRIAGPWRITIHPQHGNAAHARRHVHIARKGIKGEYSWNIDGTPHDRHGFPDDLAQVEAAKEHAATALKIDKGDLTYLFRVEPKNRVSIRTACEEVGPTGPLFSIYVRRTGVLHILSDGEALHCVCTDAPSLNQSANGRPLGPGWQYAVHFHRPGLGAPP